MNFSRFFVAAPVRAWNFFQSRHRLTTAAADSTAFCSRAREGVAFFQHPTTA
jgi:hypothetical protein